MNTSKNNFPTEPVHHGSQKNYKRSNEIFCDGLFYDVTDFISRHPGGSIIKFYTENGEDATHAIQQFHFRSNAKVETIMKSLPKRLAGPEPSDVSSKTLRHKMLSDGFNTLFNELKAEGYFEPSFAHVAIRLIESLGLLLLAIGCFFNSQAVMTKFVSTIACGFAMSRLGWLQHEAGHNSLTGRPKVDRFIQDLVTCFTLGCSSRWWNSQHNRHHAMPQRLEHDVDLSTLPFVAFHKRTVKHRKEINTFFVRYQAFLYWTLDLFLVTFLWRCVIHPRYHLHKKAYFMLVLGIPNLIYSFYVVGIFWYYLMGYWFALFLGINFALSHSHLDVADKPAHWVEFAFTHTANIKPSLFVDYFMGYLNYQIEHHLFPAMPQFRQREISHRVKTLAEKHGLPYRVYGYMEACALTIKNLNDVGKTLTTN